MKKLFIAFFLVHVNYLVSMHSLQELAAKKIINYSTCIRTIINNKCWSSNNIVNTIISEPIWRIQSENLKKLLNSVYNQKIKKRKVFDLTVIAPYDYDFVGKIEIGFGESFKSIIINCQGKNIIRDELFDYRPINKIKNVIGCYKIDLKGKEKEYSRTLYTSPNFNNKLRRTSSSSILEYGLDIKDSVFIHPNKKIILSINSAGQVYLHDLQEREAMKSICETQLSFSQMLLLNLIVNVKEKNRPIRLTKKEQKIYESLLPDIKKLINNNLITYHEQKASFISLVHPFISYALNLDLLLNNFYIDYQ